MARGDFRAAVLAVNHAGGDVALEGQPVRQGVQFHHQPPFVANRLQIGAGGAGTLAVAGGGLVETDAVLAVAVEVVAIGQVQLLAGADKRHAQRMAIAVFADRQQPVGAVVVVGQAFVGLGAFEVGQHLPVAPAGAAIALGPVVVILRLAAQVDHAVDRTAAAQHFALRDLHAAVIGVRFRFRFVGPALFGDDLGHAGRHLDKQVIVVAAGFQQQHPRLGAADQLRRQHAAGGTGADDDVIKGIFRHDSSPCAIGILAE